MKANPKPGGHLRLVRSPPKTGPRHCRECGAAIVLVRVLPSRRYMLLNLRPSPLGTFIVHHDSEGVHWAAHHSLAGAEYSGPLWVYHRAVCPKRPPKPPKPRPPEPVQMELSFWERKGGAS
jgi:hypothetical protein